MLMNTEGALWKAECSLEEDFFVPEESSLWKLFFPSSEELSESEDALRTLSISQDVIISFSACI